MPEKRRFGKIEKGVVAAAALGAAVVGHEAVNGNFDELLATETNDHALVVRPPKEKVLPEGVDRRSDRLRTSSKPGERPVKNQKLQVEKPPSVYYLTMNKLIDLLGDKYELEDFNSADVPLVAITQRLGPNESQSVADIRIENDGSLTLLSDGGPEDEFRIKAGPAQEKALMDRLAFCDELHNDYKDFIDQRLPEDEYRRRLSTEGFSDDQINRKIAFAHGRR